MIVEHTNKEIVFRLPSNTKIDDLQDFFDFLTYKDLTKKSKVAQKQVDNLVKEVKKGRWEKTKEKLGL